MQCQQRRGAALDRLPPTRKRRHIPSALSRSPSLYSILQMPMHVESESLKCAHGISCPVKRVLCKLYLSAEHVSGKFTLELSLLLGTPESHAEMSALLFLVFTFIHQRVENEVEGRSLFSVSPGRFMVISRKLKGRNPRVWTYRGIAVFVSVFPVGNLRRPLGMPEPQAGSVASHHQSARLDF